MAFRCLKMSSWKDSRSERLRTDNSRAGLFWDVTDRVSVTDISPFEPGRWGVWGVSFPHPMNSRDNVRRNLELILPTLNEKWNEWREKFHEAR